MNYILTFLSAFAVTVILMPLIIKLTKKLKVRQTVLHYVKEHEGKSGTPTMGGIGFIIALLVTFIFSFNSDKSLMIMTVVVTIGYGIVGFLDDFIKIFFKRNDGLSPLQKIIFQLTIAVIVSIFAYNNDLVSSTVYLFFGFNEVDFGFFSIFIYIFVFVLMTNSVNLTDGLDGLASSVTIVYTAVFGLIMYLSVVFLGGQATDELKNLIIFCCALVGGLIGFLCFNGFPARIFMGDTGSLALGGALSCLAIFSKRVMLVPFLGVMYMLSSLSVIIQVLYYKKTKKRVFLMAPLHHHYQKKGIHESKIVLYYTIITSVMGAAILLTMLFIVA